MEPTFETTFLTGTATVNIEYCWYCKAAPLQAINLIQVQFNSRPQSNHCQLKHLASSVATSTKKAATFFMTGKANSVLVKYNSAREGLV